MRAVPWRRLLSALVAIVVVLAAARLTVAEPFSIPTASMAPTLAVGDHVLADTLSYRLREPRRDELAVFTAPDSGDLLLKRIVGVGGDTVEIRDGVLFVNGDRRREPYVPYDRVDSVYFGPVRVPAGSVFVMGDDRANSRDSRDFGPVAESALVGRAVLRTWPLDRLGTLL
jgi:signal peptidase I